MENSRSTDYRNRVKTAIFRANELTDNTGLSNQSHISPTVSSSFVSSARTNQSNQIYNEHYSQNDISMTPIEDEFEKSSSQSEYLPSNCPLDATEIINNLLINYQITTNTSDSAMEKLLKLVNLCARLKGLENDIFPQTYYELTKNISVSSCGMRFICKKEECKKLTKPIYRERSKSYALIKCSHCSQTIDPLEETNGPRGYFVQLDPVGRIKNMLENDFVRNHIKFCKEEEFAQIEGYGKFNSGRIYRKEMQTGDLSLTFFADGVKVFGSSSNDFWPALLSLNELHSSIRKDFVIPAAIYFGRKKPSGEHMIECIKDDLTILATKGVDWSPNGSNSLEVLTNNTKIKTLFGVFDSQAKPAFLNMQYPSGFKSCPKCYISAEKKLNNTIFGYSNQLKLRHNDHYPSLLEKMQRKHLVEHCGIYGQPALSALPFYDPIKSTTIDFMHCIDLGITNRIVSLWFKSSSYKSEFYIVGKSRDELNQLIKSLKPPDNLPRTIRPLSDLVNYKASEWNSFLLYIFPIVMKRFLLAKYYNHFFMLSFAMATLLKSKISLAELYLAKRVLNKFASELEDLYGEKQLTHNAHLLLHLTEVIQDIGSLSDVNGYIFESMNGLLRNYVQGSNNVGKQIARKSELQFASKLTLTRINDHSIGANTDTMKPILRYKTNIDPRFEVKIESQFGCKVRIQFATLNYQNDTFTSQSYKRETKSCNSVVKLKNGKFFSIYCFFAVDGNIFAIGEEKVPFKNMSIEFEDDIGKYNLILPHIHIVQTLSSSVIVSIKDFDKKCLFIECDSKEYCVIISNGYAF